MLDAVGQLLALARAYQVPPDDLVPHRSGGADPGRGIATVRSA